MIFSGYRIDLVPGASRCLADKAVKHSSFEAGRNESSEERKVVRDKARLLVCR